ncbi:MAG TPA: cupin domain-containing protein [Ardenticatenaceae bacterium]|jgi:oxalate decarboxylase/phosphoglucose isomerase-like protein (cupin superfamily)
MERLGTGYVVYGDDVETLRFDWGKVKILSEPAVTGAGRFSFGMVVLEPGKGHDRHNHPDADEIIFVMSGEGDQMIDDEPPVRVRSGASIYIPQGVYHSTINRTWEPLRLLVVYSPPGSERLLREIPGCEVVPAGEH